MCTAQKVELHIGFLISIPWNKGAESFSGGTGDTLTGRTTHLIDWAAIPSEPPRVIARRQGPLLTGLALLEA